MTILSPDATRPLARLLGREMPGSASGPDGREAPRPRPSPLIDADIAWLVGLNVGIVLAMWIRHGGLSELTTPAGWLTAVGQLAGLIGALAVLGQLILIARIPWLERRYGMDRLNGWHRWVGFAATWLLIGHVVAITAGYAAGLETTVWAQVVDFFATYPWMASAFAGFALLVLVTVTSVRAARRSMSYEAWWLVHLYAYLGVALAFMHQLAVGSDFVHDPVATAYWIVLYGLVAAVVLGYRWVSPLAAAIRHRLRVAQVVQEGPGVVTITLAGRQLDRLAVEAGQFFLLRFLRPDRWWKAHPLSISAVPDGHSLRFTVKALGDDTAALLRIPIGTRVMAEGPYGAFTGARAGERPVLLIAGGIGITPIRALYEDLDRRPGEVDLLYRTRSRADAVLLDELMAISARRGYGLSVSYSRPDGLPTGGNPFTADVLHARIGDIASRDVYICGPARLTAEAHRGLRGAGVPADRIHFERFDY